MQVEDSLSPTSYMTPAWVKGAAGAGFAICQLLLFVWCLRKHSDPTCLSLGFVAGLATAAYPLPWLHENLHVQGYVWGGVPRHLAYIENPRWSYWYVRVDPDMSRRQLLMGVSAPLMLVVALGLLAAAAVFSGHIPLIALFGASLIAGIIGMTEDIAWIIWALRWPASTRFRSRGTSLEAFVAPTHP